MSRATLSARPARPRIGLLTATGTVASLVVAAVLAVTGLAGATPAAAASVPVRLTASTGIAAATSSGGSRGSRLDQDHTFALAGQLKR